jgi:hypothetical protein
MPWTIIVASDDADQLDLLLEAAEGIKSTLDPTERHRIINAMTVDHVRKLRKTSRGSENGELLILTATLPSGDGTTTGFDLVKHFQQEDNPPRCILISDCMEHYPVVQTMKSCELLFVNAGTDYFDLCLHFSRKLGVVRDGGDLLSIRAREIRIPEEPPTPEQIAIPLDAAPRQVQPRSKPEDAADRSFALVEVDLKSKAKFSTVKLLVNTPGGRMQAQPFLLHLNQNEVNGLIKDSRDLTNRIGLGAADWKQDYSLLGGRIHKLLFTPKFSEYYGHAQGAAPGNVRLRFNLEQSVFEGLWEAVFDGSNNRFLMLDTVVTRRASQEFDNFNDRLDFGNGVLNVLAIKSSVPKDSKPIGPNDPLWKEFSQDIELTELLHLDQEMEILKNLQEPSKASDVSPSLIPEFDVTVLPGGHRCRSLAETVERELKRHSDRYDVLHFAGHALFARGRTLQDDRGYLIFSGNPRPQAVPIATVSSWIANTSIRLVYLSCCRSSAAQVAIEFARRNVPMTIGFTWDLDDEKAVDFAGEFYSELRNSGLKVCSAFCKARRRLHERYDGGDPIWAAPVLVAQPLEWIQVENHLGRSVMARANHGGELHDQ